MKKYVFEESLMVSWGKKDNKQPFKRNQLIDTLEAAMWYSGAVWHNLSDETKQNFYNSENGCFEVYEIDITEEQMEEYEQEIRKFDLRELETRIVWDYLERYIVRDEYIDRVYGNTEGDVIDNMQENGWRLDELLDCTDNGEVPYRKVMEFFRSEADL